MSKRIAILGHGLAATVANNSLADFHPILFSGSDKPVGNLLESHHAIMRFRHPEIGYMLGCDLKRVNVWKQIYWAGELRDQPSIAMNNLYSLKVSSAISSRSIIETGIFDRYILPRGVVLSQPASMVGVDWQDILRRQIVEDEFEFLISTIPLDVLAQYWAELIGEGRPPENLSFEFKNIEVVRLQIPFESEVFQTIYFPESEFATYRASLEGDILTLEGIAPIEQEEATVVLGCFGIDAINLAVPVEKNTQKRGKIVPADDDMRRNFIHYLTAKYRIISFGRFAIWKSIRTDDLLHDIKIIRRIMSSSPAAVEYNIRKEHSK